MRLSWKRRQSVVVPEPGQPLPGSLETFISADDVGLRAYPYEPPNVLRIVVLRARGLKIMDKAGKMSMALFGGSGSSDPMVRLSVDSNETTTTVKKKSLNPVWMEPLTLGAVLAKSKLSIVVEDYDLLSANDFMGRCEVPFSVLKDRKQKRAWHKLVSDDEEEDLGELEIVVRWMYDANFALEIPKGGPMNDKDAHLSEPPNEVHVLLICCKNLPVMDYSITGKGSSDPFVTFELLGEKKKSTVKNAKLNPEYMEYFIFPAEDEEQSMEVQVWDYDLGSRNDLIGTAAVPLASIVDRKLHRQWFALTQTDDDNPFGSVELALRWRHNPKLVLPLAAEMTSYVDKAKKPPNELIITLFRAVDLPIMDANFFSTGGTTDPVVTFGLDGETKKSSVQKKTCNPSWSETLRMDCDDPSTSLKVQVDDWDLVGLSNDRIGVVTIAIPRDRKVSRRWHAVELDTSITKSCKPSLDIALRWVHNPQKVLELPEAMQQPDDDTASPNKLLVTLIRAKSLPVADKNILTEGGSSDPFVTLEVDGETAKSTVKKKNLKPLWLEFFEIPAEAASYEQHLRLTVEDYDLIGANDFMGEVLIPMSTLDDRQLRRQWYPLQARGGGASSEIKEELGSVEVALRWIFDPAFVVALPEAILRQQDEDEDANELCVALIRARGLAVMDKNRFSSGGSSDPVVTMELDGAISRSTVQRKTITPLWNECFDMALEEPDAPLTVTVEDHDDLSSRDLMGSFTVAFYEEHEEKEGQEEKKKGQEKEKGQEGEEKGVQEEEVSLKPTPLLETLRAGKTWRAWYALEGEGKGRVELALRWRYNETRATPVFPIFTAPEEHPDKEPNSLLVMLLRARNLPIMDHNLLSKGGSSDPYVSMKIGREPALVSTVKKKDLNPVWMESFEMPVEDIEEQLTISILDKDRIGRDDPMGDVQLRISNFADRRLNRRWHEITPHKKIKKILPSKIELAFRWVYNPDLVFKIPPDMTSREEHTEMPANLLRVCLVRARNLPIANRSIFSSGSSDPYCEIQLGSTTVKSTVKVGKLAPVWCERFDMAVEDDIESMTLNCKVFDYDVSGSKQGDFMGQLTLPLRSIAHRRPTRTWYKLRGETDDEVQGMVELALRLVHDPKYIRGCFYDPDNANDRAKITKLCKQAIDEEKDEKLKLLYVRGASCDHVRLGGKEQQTPMHVVAMRPPQLVLDDSTHSASSSKSGGGVIYKTLYLLLQLKVDISQGDDRGRTPLHVAAMHDRGQTCKDLVALGAYVEAEDKMGKSALHLAAAAGADDALQTLIKLRSPLMARSSHGLTAACLAAQHGHRTTLRLLLLNDNLEEEAGSSEYGSLTLPIHLAAASGHAYVVEILVRELKADVDAQDGQGLTAAHHAAMNGHFKVLTTLRFLNCDLRLLDDENHTAEFYLDHSDHIEVDSLSDGSLSFDSDDDENERKQRHDATSAFFDETRLTVTPRPEELPPWAKSKS